MKKYTLKSLIFIRLIFSICTNSFAQSPAARGPYPTTFILIYLRG